MYTIMISRKDGEEEEEEEIEYCEAETLAEAEKKVDDAIIDADISVTVEARIWYMGKIVSFYF